MPKSILRQFADSATALAWTMDLDGKWLFTYPAVLASKGSIFTLSDWLAFVHQEDVDAVRTAVMAAKLGGKESSSEYRIIKRDGTVRWMLALITPRYTEAGKLDGCNGTTFDVTARRQSSVAMAANEAHYRQLVEQSSDQSLEREAREASSASEERFRSLTALSSEGYWETDAEERITFVSDGLLRILGVTAKALLGQSWKQMAVNPDSPNVLAYCRAVARREPFRDLTCINSVSPGGEEFHLSLSGEPRYENGIFSGYRAIVRDVTVERGMLQQLARLAEANRALIQNSPDIIMVFDSAGYIRRAEGAVMSILGFEPEALAGHHYLEFVEPDAPSDSYRDLRYDSDMQILIATVDDHHITMPRIENRWRRKDGRIVHLSWAARRSADLSLIHATARDVTETLESRSALYRINRRLNAMLESIGDGFISVDRDWRLTYVNLKAAEIVNKKRDMMLGKLLWEAAPEIRNSPLFSRFQHAMLNEENTFFECYSELCRGWVDVRIYSHEEGLSIYFRDITERYEAEQLVREREQRFREMIGLTPAGYVEANAQGFIQEVNPALCAMSGYCREELIGRHITAFIDNCPIGDALKVREGPVSAHGKEAVLRDKQGNAVYLLANVTIKRDANGNALSLTAFVTDITDRKQVADQLAHVAMHDMLTGLPNRVLMRRHLQRMLESEPADNAVAVMFVDLDRFKQVNDTMGHAAGDLVLQEAGRRLQQLLQPGDLVARFGGDEFVIAAYCPNGRPTAAALADSLLTAMAETFQIDGHEVFIGASIGISMVTEHARTKQVLFQNADMAMYHAKASGRNQYRFFEEEMAAEVKTRLELEEALRHALDRDQLRLHYQPQVDLSTGRIVGMEALLRWQHPVWGSVPPTRFIPVAEETGLIIPIGDWVLRTACRQTAAWRAAGLGDLRIAVNVSARQFSQSGLTNTIVTVLKETGLPAHLLDLELTESMLMSNLEHTIDVLNQLKRLGIKLSVDDFGTGYSSLAYLKRFPIDMLKIDRSFVQEISHYQYDAAIPDAIIAMAHSLGIRVIAEGVEAEVQCEVLIRQMCDEIQGFLFSEALPPAEIEQLLRQGQTLPSHLLRTYRRPRTLLLVDDEPNILSALRRQLRSAGYQVLTASSGTEGLDLLARNQVDVIVSDQRMPGMTGVDFLRTVKKLYPDTVRIVLSGFTELQAVTDAVNEGAIYKFLTKPWDDTLLREHIAEAFSHKEMADENRHLNMVVREANQGLATANRRLEDVLKQQERKIRHGGITLDIVREVLQQVPVPIFGLNDDRFVTFANAAAHRLFPDTGSLLDCDAQALMPEVMRAVAHVAQGQTPAVEFAGCRFGVTCRHMGNGTRSLGMLIMLMPPGLANYHDLSGYATSLN